MIRNMCFSSAHLLVALLLMVAFYKNCKASDGYKNCSGLCGHHTVSSPFRLRDFAEQCGDHRYELSCEHNQLVLYSQSGRYSVLSINYENYTIRVRDAEVVELNYSSLPRDSLTDYNFSYRDPYALTIETNYEDGSGAYNRLTKIMIYVRCKSPVDASVFVDTAPCFKNSSRSVAAASSYVYASVIGRETAGEWGLGDDCGIEIMYMTSWPAPKNQSWSCEDIHNMLVYGFELSWLNSDCLKVGGYAYLDESKQRHCAGSSINYIIFEDILFFLQFFIENLLPIILAGKCVFGAPFVIVLLIYKWRGRHLSMYDNIEDFLQSDNNIMPIRYSYRDIKKMTKGFKIRLGKGGFGSVFKGQLRSGRDVAVKILDKANTDGQEFINEVSTLGRIHHVNVVQLIGYCVERSKRALIYEFMQNGSLEKYIFSKLDENDQSLNVHQLYAISLGVARGIEYLHKGCAMQILHFDIKPHNILLDDNFIPKVSDFGLAKLYPTNNSIVSLTAARGTIGYMAPELFYRNVGGVSYKADIYSFGMLLMEMTGRRKNLNVLVEHSSQFYFPFWVYDQLNEGNEISIADATGEEMKLARKMLIVGLWCIQTKPNDRPSMNKVVEMLEAEEQDLELPQKPYLYPSDLPAANHDSDHSTSTRPSKSSNRPSMNEIVEMLEGEEQELELSQYSQDFQTIDASDHICSTSPSSNPSVSKPKETTSFLTKEDERSI
ncbi:LEAF RUST 10 DISEASE-RESISTANCE LOCUS RECEPTOR-LIKE PROTEIN KINASE-like 2.2 [Prosopis cineraria]|uniref:LEAF RUST 10 DISEASE-RESISTANCE LOCUS RECEPTOR-LIKE PROTEIN KINASE-like 2.2 n=1 Tax=Prosopis cineraria TaxID=364024 RepID=UPI00240FF4BC|nr:LEAF RUST 10 DISEASE-RESISTANCE LOCUS RECEPTOR-LIKE PROTEIN KINASE-like 2.2 [Prosopis cineraria]